MDEVLAYLDQDYSKINLEKLIKKQPDPLRKMVDAQWMFTHALISIIFPDIKAHKYPMNFDLADSIMTDDASKDFDFQSFSHKAMFMYLEKFAPELYQILLEIEDSNELFSLTEGNDVDIFNEVPGPILAALTELDKASTVFYDWKEKGGKPVAF